MATDGLYKFETVDGLPGTVLPKVGKHQTVAFSNDVVIPHNIVDGEQIFALTEAGLEKMRQGNRMVGGKPVVTVAYMDAVDRGREAYKRNAIADPGEAGIVPPPAPSNVQPDRSAVAKPGQKAASAPQAGPVTAVASALEAAPAPLSLVPGGLEASRPMMTMKPGTAKFVGNGFSFSAQFAHIGIEDIYLVLVHDEANMQFDMPASEQLSIVWNGIRYVCLPGPKFRLNPNDRGVFMVYLVETSMTEPK